MNLDLVSSILPGAASNTRYGSDGILCQTWLADGTNDQVAKVVSQLRLAE